MMEVISDSELKPQGFMILVRTFGDVNAERAAPRARYRLETNYNKI